MIQKTRESYQETRTRHFFRGGPWSVISLSAMMGMDFSFTAAVDILGRSEIHGTWMEVLWNGWNGGMTV